MEMIGPFAVLVYFAISLTLLIMFILLCVNVATLVRLTRVQNEILKTMFKQQGGEIEEPTNKP